jgi:hypothetical protein
LHKTASRCPEQHEQGCGLQVRLAAGALGPA